MSQTSPVGELTIVSCFTCKGTGIQCELNLHGAVRKWCDICGGWGYYWRKPAMSGMPPAQQKISWMKRLEELFSLPRWKTA